MLFAFLHPASSILRILLLDDRAPHASTRDMGIEVLFTLASFVEVVDGSQGGVEGYDKVFYGCIDVLAARGGSFGVKRLFDRLFEEAEMSAAKSSFVLLVTEKLIHYLDVILIGRVLSICERCAPPNGRKTELTGRQVYKSATASEEL